ncbi:MAG: hypothetical protein IKV59_09580 [Lachnospiraceae bacterium]|nr:hypothetical protein [Lachnospiraceae bacterium]
MKKLFRCGIAALLVTMLSIQMFCMSVVAAEHPSIKLPVTIEQKGSYPSTAEDLNIVLKAADAACPMPEGSVDGAYTISVKSGTTAEFPEITFPKLGIYNYTIQQEAGDHARGEYDGTVYQMRVYVTNAENGNGFESTTLLYIDDINSKYAEIKFENNYTAIPSRDDDGPSNKPKNTPKETPPMDVDDVGDEDLFGVLGAFDELEIPLGLLPATGTLWWAVPILVIGGIAMMVLGRRRSRESDKYEE